jgi:hypothetical protein
MPMAAATLIAVCVRQASGVERSTRWVKDFLRFHRDRTGRWIHPQQVSEREFERFLLAG